MKEFIKARKAKLKEQFQEDQPEHVVGWINRQIDLLKDEAGQAGHDWAWTPKFHKAARAMLEEIVNA